MIGLGSRRIKETDTSTILRRIAGKDKTAVKDCIDAYGNFIWALARRLSASREEAEAATEEIFIDIWRYCEHAPNNQLSEKQRIATIAMSRLIKPLEYAKQKTIAGRGAKNEQGAGMDRISGLV